MQLRMLIDDAVVLKADEEDRRPSFQPTIVDNVAENRKSWTIRASSDSWLISDVCFGARRFIVLRDVSSSSWNRRKLEEDQKRHRHTVK